MLYLVIMLIFVFFAGLAMTINEGLWSNSVLLFCIMLGGVLAIVGGVPLGVFIVEQAGADQDSVWYFVFASVWGVFALSVTIMRLLLEQASQIRVKFVPPLEMVAGPLMGLFVAVMLTSFATYTLERIPFQAQALKVSEAADWQVTMLTYARAPFLNVAYRFAAPEGLDSEFIAH